MKRYLQSQENLGVLKSEVKKTMFSQIFEIKYEDNAEVSQYFQAFI